MSSPSTVAKPIHVPATFESGGKEIRLESFGDDVIPETPSIVILHGPTGVVYASRFVANLAQVFAANHFAVHLLHYFDRTDTRYADGLIIKGAFVDWLETIRDALELIQRNRPKARIGVFGYSLGGYLAAAEAVRDDRIEAMVLLSGGLDLQAADTPLHVPPALILHGGADTRVPLSEARRLEFMLKSAGGAPKMHIYPCEGHILNPLSYADVAHRSIGFFKEHLAQATT